MNIRSTQSQLKPQTLLKAPLTRVAKMDQDLAQGIDVADNLDLSLGFLEQDHEKLVKRDFAIQSALLGTFGGLAGCVFGDFSPLGAAAGLGMGIYVAYNRTLRADSGKVNITLDGQTRTTRYYGRPDNFKLTPQERRLEMLAKGRLGEKIFSHNLESCELPDVTISAEVKALKPQLKALSGESKLVADFGNKSRYGQPVLSQIDAQVAAKLMSAEQSVYAVAGKSEDTQHSLTVSAANQRSTMRKAQANTHFERKFDYKVTELNPQSITELPEGEGLPEGLFGVYKGQESCSVSIAQDDQRGYGTASSSRSSSRFRSTRVTSDSSIDLGPTDKAEVYTTSSINIRDLVMMSGIVIGLASGMAISPGVPPAALLGGVLGGVVGRELGWLAQDRMPSYRR